MRYEMQSGFPSSAECVVLVFLQSDSKNGSHLLGGFGYNMNIPELLWSYQDFGCHFFS